MRPRPFNRASGVDGALRRSTAKTGRWRSRRVAQNHPGEDGYRASGTRSLPRSPDHGGAAPALSFWQFGLFGWIFGTIGIVGQLLASVGVYGVLTCSVSQRTQEIGVRVALGASARDVLRLVVGDGLRLTGVGIALGLVLAPIGTWFARSLFYNVGPFDPLPFMAVAAFLLDVALLASYLPARRATHVDPLLALRAE